MDKNFVLLEHKYIYPNDFGNNITDYDEENNITVPRKLFTELETFVVDNKGDESTDTMEFLTISVAKPVVLNKKIPVLKARNYVGVLQFRNGVTIEILPKIHTKLSDEVTNEKTIAVEDTRIIFIRMLKTLRNTPFKHFETANLKSAKISLFEIFIHMFLDELGKLIRKGIKSAYLIQMENLVFLKGKLKIEEHIRRNYINKHKFYVEYDEYLPNRPENRLIKSTLTYLSRITKSSQLQGRLRKYIFILDEVEESFNIEQDFSLCKNNRLMSYYEQTLKWCRIFLKKESFTNYKGDTLAFALLFPMEKIFESYVTFLLKKRFSDWEIKNQKSLKHLIEEPKKFHLRPDIIMQKEEIKKIILDAKWKIINEKKTNYGISQSDLYQMYAYGKKYDVDTLYLLYPYNQNFPGPSIEKRRFVYEQNETKDARLILHICPIFLSKETDNEILSSLESSINKNQMSVPE